MKDWCLPIETILLAKLSVFQGDLLFFPKDGSVIQGCIAMLPNCRNVLMGLMHQKCDRLLDLLALCHGLFWLYVHDVCCFLQTN